MKKILFTLLAAGALSLTACTDRNHNGDPDYKDNEGKSTTPEGDDFERTRKGSSAGTITDANDTGRTDATHHPTEGAAITATPSNEVDSIQTLPK